MIVTPTSSAAASAFAKNAPKSHRIQPSSSGKIVHAVLEVLKPALRCVVDVFNDRLQAVTVGAFVFPRIVSLNLSRLF